MIRRLTKNQLSHTLAGFGWLGMGLSTIGVAAPLIALGAPFVLAAPIAGAAIYTCDRLATNVADELCRRGR